MREIQVINCQSCPYRHEGEYGTIDYGDIYCNLANKRIGNLKNDFPKYCPLKEVK